MDISHDSLLHKVPECPVYWFLSPKKENIGKGERKNYFPSW
jgi:hypothetical protein